VQPGLAGTQIVEEMAELAGELARRCVASTSGARSTAVHT
jgi:hypothetical protein